MGAHALVAAYSEGAVYIAAWRLDFDDFRAVVTQHLGSKGAKGNMAHFDHAQAG